MSNTRKFFNLQTGETTTVDLTSEEIAAREAIATENAKTKYVTDRLIHGKDSDGNSTTYLNIGEQLDMLYKDLVAGKLDSTGTWATHIKNVKDSNPKPS